MEIFMKDFECDVFEFLDSTQEAFDMGRLMDYSSRQTIMSSVLLLFLWMAGFGDHLAPRGINTHQHMH